MNDYKQYCPYETPPLGEEKVNSRELWVVGWKLKIEY